MATRIIKLITSCALALALMLPLCSGTSLAAPSGDVVLRYLGHAAFLLSQGDHSLLIDPYIETSSLAKSLKPQYILVTHNHFDHVGDAAAIAKSSGALVLTPPGVTSLNQQFIQVGERKEFDFGWVLATPANHPEVSGTPVGFIIHFYGVTVYHAGDTHWLPEMEKIARQTPIDVALLPIGGKYTMDSAEAAKLAGLIKPKLAIPMHYNTFPDIQASPLDFKAAAEKNYSVPVKLMTTGQKLVLLSAPAEE